MPQVSRVTQLVSSLVVWPIYGARRVLVLQEMRWFLLAGERRVMDITEIKR
ncbi:MAG TPA: hypothetical protein G4N94_00390 [Caldilineae bacterium]|nr:hypothetical protein [Caldilineae bacterium]